MGQVVAKLLSKDAKTVDVIRFAVMASNYGFMGYPVIEALLGKGALFSLTMYNLPYYITTNTIGIYMLNPNRRESKASFKDAVAPVSVSILLGIVLFLIPTPLPKIAQDTINLAGNTVTPLSMIMTGMILGGHNFGRMFNSLKIYLITFIRLIIIPICVFTVLKLLGFSGESLSIPVLISAMPVAANLAVFANQLESDSYTAHN